MLYKVVKKSGCFFIRLANWQLTLANCMVKNILHWTEIIVAKYHKETGGEVLS